MPRVETVVYIATSLDGFIARPDGGIDWLGDPQEGEDYGWADFHASIDGVLLGRKTFDTARGFLAAGYPWIYGELPVTVWSRSQVAAPAGCPETVRFTAQGAADLLEDLAARGQRRVYVDGGQTIQTLLRAGLVDAMVLTRIPVLIGQGIPLFGPLDADLRWRHEKTQTWPTGLVKSWYRRDG